MKRLNWCWKIRSKFYTPFLNIVFYTVQLHVNHPSSHLQGCESTRFQSSPPSPSASRYREAVISANLPASATLLTLPACAISQAVKSFIPWSLFLIGPHMDFVCSASVWGKAQELLLWGQETEQVQLLDKLDGVKTCSVDPSQILLGPELPGS